MRVTLTLDEELTRELEARAARAGATLEDTLLNVVRRALVAREPPQDRFVVDARPCGFQPDIDPERLSRVADDIELDRFREKLGTKPIDP